MNPTEVKEGHGMEFILKTWKHRMTVQR